MTTKAEANNPCRQLSILIATIIVVWLTYYLRSIIIPFFIGAILAYFGNIFVKKLEKHRLKHMYAVTITFFLIFAIILIAILLLVPFIQNQLITLNTYLPKIISWIQNQALPWFNDSISETSAPKQTIKSMVTENFVNADVLKWVLQTALKSGQTLFEILMFMILIPVVTFYMLRDWDSMRDRLISLLPSTSRTKVLRVFSECEEVLGAFFRGQVIVITILSVVYSVGFYLIGLHLGIAIGIMTGLLSLVPYLGLIVGAIVASIAAFVQFGTIWSVFWALSVVLIGHIIDNLFLTPSLLGERIGLHPVLVIFAVLAGGLLLGFIGILLALPIAAVLLVVSHHVYKTYS